MTNLKIETRSALPIETRDNGDPLAEATAAVSELRTAFANWQTRTDGELESRASADELRQLIARFDELETRIQRPGATGAQPDAEAELETRAFLNFVRHGREGMEAEEIRALNASTASAGGILAPDRFYGELIKLLIEFSPVRQYARVMSIGVGGVQFPRRVSGTTAYWTTETGTRQKSEPVYELLQHVPGELATYVEVSNILLEDNSYGLEGELRMDLAEAFGVAESAAFVSGDGDNKPRGILIEDEIAEVVTGSPSAFPSSNPADVIIKAFHAIPQAWAQRGVWLMNRTTLGVLRTWKDLQGRYLVADPISEGSPVTLLGRPIAEAVDMPDIEAGAVPVMFGDLQGYRVIDRVGLDILRDPFTQATNGLTRFHSRKRVGGLLTNPDRFVKIKVAAS